MICRVCERHILSFWDECLFCSSYNIKNEHKREPPARGKDAETLDSSGRMCPKCDTLMMYSYLMMSKWSYIDTPVLRCYSCGYYAYIPNRKGRTDR